MALSRRLRFEILRRDEHACRYCGARAPDVKLTVDHVVPVALGGTDDPSNLVTACSPCNAGKASIAPDAPIVGSVADDALRWAAAIKRAGAIQAARTADRCKYIDDFDAMWCDWTFADGATVVRPQDWEQTIGRSFDLELDASVLQELVRDVMPRIEYVGESAMWRYFCGALRNVTTERAEIAAQLLAEGAVNGDRAST